MSKPRRRADVENRVIGVIDYNEKRSRTARESGALAIALDRVADSRAVGEREDGVNGNPVEVQQDNIQSLTDIRDKSKDDTYERDNRASVAMEQYVIERVRKYWYSRGCIVDIEMNLVFAANQKSTYRAARSNMVNGLPTGYGALNDRPLAIDSPKGAAK